MSTRDETFAVTGPATVSVTVKSGSVDVRSAATDRVRIVIKGDDVDSWQVSQLGDSIALEPERRSAWRVRTVRVLVEVPDATDLTVSTASADVQVVGTLGQVRVKTASGAVRTDAVEHLDVQTASGDTHAGGIDATAEFASASGDVFVERVGGRLSVTTASGDVTVSHAADDVEIGSASGDVRVEHYDGDDITVKTISGDVALGLPAGIRVEPDIRTLSGRTTLPEPRPTPQASADVPRRVVRVGLRTVSGDIAVRRV